VGPARMIAESLTPKPGIREQSAQSGHIKLRQTRFSGRPQQTPRHRRGSPNLQNEGVLMTRRKIIAQMIIGSETRPIKAKFRNASSLWDTHQRDLWVLHFIRRSPPRPSNIVQHDCGNVNDPPSATETRGTSSRALVVAVRPTQRHDFSTRELDVVIGVRIIPAQVLPPITPFVPPAPRCSSYESPASGTG